MKTFLPKDFPSGRGPSTSPMVTVSPKYVRLNKAAVQKLGWTSGQRVIIQVENQRLTLKRDGRGWPLQSKIKDIGCLSLGSPKLCEALSAELKITAKSQRYEIDQLVANGAVADAFTTHKAA